MLKRFLVLLCLLCPAGAYAQATTGSWNDGPLGGRDGPIAVAKSGSAFTAVAINTAQTTDAMKLKGFRYVLFTLNYTRSTGTAVTMTCQNSENNTTWADIHVLSVATAPTLTSGIASWVYTTSASKVWNWSVPVRGVYLRCTFTATGGGAGDLLTLSARGGI